MAHLTRRRRRRKNLSECGSVVGRLQEHRGAEWRDEFERPRLAAEPVEANEPERFRPLLGQQALVLAEVERSRLMSRGGLTSMNRSRPAESNERIS